MLRNENTSAKSVDPLQYLFGLEKLGIKFGLDNIQRIVAALGSPHESYRSILIAGTNGKGSVTAMVERALRAAGLRTARYTSPHLVRLEERFAVDGMPIDSSALRDGVADIQQVVERLLAQGQLAAPPTFFEVTTAVALELFRRRGVEIAVLEVGLGGRLDATNVVTPIMTAITSIDLDHQALLGPNLSDIAAEKAGIVKAGVPMLVGETKPQPVDVIAGICREQNAPLVHAASQVEVVAHVDQDGVTTLDASTPTRRYPRMRLALRGRHQVRNAVTALRLLEELPLPGISQAAIAAGLTDVNWPGRLELLEDGHSKWMLLDSAHNPAGAAVLADYLSEVYPQRIPIIFGAMHDKDAENMLVALRRSASVFVLTSPQLDRSATPESLAALAERVAPGVPRYVANTLEAAAMRAWQHADIVCATGSIFLIGEILLFFEHSARVPAWRA